ncbi:uncharacterized protein LOC124616692 [Schistocerca americana]|uniref:uncharacterized protein LOC124616692 n=1 Tax=Schistocerca americana TaxID=7009 RepID=UPI001F4F68E0|nr:uncharacterized protein LOC124616692 [Schistocerca americana]
MEFSGWKVRSSSRRSTDYFVYDNDFQCNCRLMCIKCRACIHRYSCTCIDYTIKWNMCKHIHSVCQIQLKQQPSEHLRNSEVTLTESEDISVVDEETEILVEVTKKSVNDSVPLSVQRRELIAEFSGIVSELTSNDLETAKKMLSSLKATVAVGMLQQKQAPLQIERKQSQKILPQHRLYSTKKNKRSNNASLVLPNSEESSLMKLSLLADKEDALVGKGSAVKKQPTIKNTEGVAGPFPITACALQHSPTNRSTPMIQPIAKQAEVVSSQSLATSYVLKHSPRNICISACRLNFHNSTNTKTGCGGTTSIHRYSACVATQLNKWCCSPTFKPVTGQDKMVSVPSLTTAHVLQHGYGMQPVMPGNSQIN